MNITSWYLAVTWIDCSAGVSYQIGFLAKNLASDINNPDGMSVILPEEGQAFIEQLKIEKFSWIR